LLGNGLENAFPKHLHATIGSPLLGNRQLNTFPLKSVTTIGSVLLSNDAVNRLRQQYRLCFPLGSCKVVIRKANSEAGSFRRSIERQLEENLVESSKLAAAGNGRKISQ
jgi:hypothetical protein